MRTFAALIAGMLLSAGMGFAQQNPPPGADTLGSQPSTSRPGNAGTATVDPQENQRTTHSTGSTTGDTRNPDFSGSAPNPARGVQGQNPSSGAEAAPSATPNQFHPTPQHKNDKKSDKGKATQKKAPRDRDKQPPQGAADEGTSPGQRDDAFPLTNDPGDSSEPDVVVITPRGRLLAVIRT